MEILSNEQLLTIFENNSWDAEETKEGKIIAYTCNGGYAGIPFTEGDIDVTGWTAKQVEDKFGFNEVDNNEASYFRNSTIFGYSF